MNRLEGIRLQTTELTLLAAYVMVGTCGRRARS